MAGFFEQLKLKREFRRYIRTLSFEELVFAHTELLGKNPRVEWMIDSAFAEIQKRGRENERYLKRVARTGRP